MYKVRNCRDRIIAEFATFEEALFFIKLPENAGRNLRASTMAE